MAADGPGDLAGLHERPPESATASSTSAVDWSGEGKSVEGADPRDEAASRGASNPTIANDHAGAIPIAPDQPGGPVAVIYAFETEDKAVELRRPTTARAKRRSATKSPELVKDNQSDPPYRIVRTRHKRAADAHE